MEKDFDYFDLQYRAYRAISALTREQDPRVGNLTPFTTQWTVDPPCAVHNVYDYGDGVGRILDALNLIRIMTGSKKCLVEETVAHDNLFSWIGKDGLPWVQPDDPWLVMSAPFVEAAWHVRGPIMALTTIWQRTGDNKYRRACQDMISGFAKYAQYVDDYCYLPGRCITEKEWCKVPGDVAANRAEWNAVSISPMLRFYEQSRFEPALDFARRMVRFVVNHAGTYHEDGAMRLSGHSMVHFHSRSSFIAAALKLALIDGDEELLAWGIRAYETARALGTSFGWFPENLRNILNAETCSIVDMIEIAILLARNVDRKYWGDAERFGRNQLLEHQLWDVDWTKNLMPRRTEPEGLHSDDPREFMMADLEKRIGGFAFYGLVNDLGHSSESSQTRFDGLCCHGAGARGLYDMWHYAVEEKDSEIWIHLHTDRETESVGVQHNLEEGKVLIRAKRKGTVYFRLPESVSASGCRVRLNDKDIRPEVGDGYVKFAELSEGDSIFLIYSLEERHEILVRDKNYELTWKGELLQSIEPPGSIKPLYHKRKSIPATDEEHDIVREPHEKEIDSI